jgi:hypothetical protein
MRSAVLGDVFLDSSEFKTAVRDTFQHAVELGLIMKKAAQGCDTVAGFESEPFKSRREALAQPTPDGDDISAFLHRFPLASLRIIRLSWVTRPHPGAESPWVNRLVARLGWPHGEGTGRRHEGRRAAAGLVEASAACPAAACVKVCAH